jgi:hypothetical protein
MSWPKSQQAFFSRLGALRILLGFLCAKCVRFCVQTRATQAINTFFFPITTSSVFQREQMEDSSRNSSDSVEDGSGQELYICDCGDILDHNMESTYERECRNCKLCLVEYRYCLTSKQICHYRVCSDCAAKMESICKLCEEDINDFSSANRSIFSALERTLNSFLDLCMICNFLQPTLSSCFNLCHKWICLQCLIPFTETKLRHISLLKQQKTLDSDLLEFEKAKLKAAQVRLQRYKAKLNAITKILEE